MTPDQPLSDLLHAQLRGLGVSRITVDANRCTPTSLSHEPSKVSYIELLNEDRDEWVVRFSPGGPIWNHAKRKWTWLDDDPGDVAFYFYKPKERREHAMPLAQALAFARDLVGYGRRKSRKAS